MKKINTRKIVTTAILSSISTVLMFLSFNVPLMPDFIKFDFSELPALIASFTVGPIYGVVVCLIKNIINLPASTTGGIGELCNFLLGCCYVLPAGMIYKYKKTKKQAVIGCLIGSISIAAFSVPINYFVAYPAYAKLIPLDIIIDLYKAINPNVDGLLSCLLIFNLPFTLIKGLIESVITFFIYKYISPIIHGRKNKSESKDISKSKKKSDNKDNSNI